MKKLEISQLEYTNGGGCFVAGMTLVGGLLGVGAGILSGNPWALFAGATVAFSGGYQLASGGCL